MHKTQKANEEDTPKEQSKVKKKERYGRWRFVFGPTLSRLWVRWCRTSGNEGTSWGSSFWQMAKSKRHAKQFKVSRRKFGGQLHRSLLGGLLPLLFLHLLLLLRCSSRHRLTYLLELLEGKSHKPGKRQLATGKREQRPGFSKSPIQLNGTRAVSSASCCCSEYAR